MIFQGGETMAGGTAFLLLLAPFGYLVKLLQTASPELAEKVSELFGLGFVSVLDILEKIVDFVNHL